MSLRIESESKGFDKTFQILNDVGGIVEQDLVELLMDLGNEIVDGIKSDIQTQAHVVTGELLASVKILEQDKNFVKVGSEDPIASILEYGRHEVKPVSKKTLHWVDPHTGEDVFARKSKAVEPTFIFENNVIKSASKFPEKINQKLQSDIDRTAR